MLGDANAISGYKKQIGATTDQKKKRSCWKCGGSFPHSTDCPRKSESCDYCGKSSHVQQYCKQFKKDNKNKGSSNDEKAKAIQVVGLNGSVSQFSKVLSKRLGYQWLNVEKDSCST